MSFRIFVKRVMTYLSFFALSTLPLVTFAQDLVQVYQQALGSDPTFKAAEGQWLSDKETLPISRAALLPQVDVTGSVSRDRIDNDTKNFNVDKDIVYYDSSRNYGLTLTQPIFNFASWMAVSDARNVVKAAEATYSSAAQDLMYRVASSYFAVLQAHDTLQYTQAEEASIGKQLEQTRQKYKVGIVAITDVYDAEARYNAVVADEIAARNDVANALENLRAIAGEHYSYLTGVNEMLPLVNPNPSNIDDWVNTAEKQNYTLLAAHYTALAARENIKQQAGAGLPTLNATGGYDDAYDDNAAGNGKATVKTGTIGLALNFPVFQGGLVVASTRQANYQYQQASAVQEETHRSIVNETRQAYLGVLTGISKIKADKQAIISAQSALRTTRAAYLVGTRTMVDVLQAESELYEAQKNYSQDQYSYLLNILGLKQAAGTLSAKDLAEVNSWLNDRTKVSVYIPGAGEKSDLNTTNQEDESTSSSKEPTSQGKSLSSPKEKVSAANTNSSVQAIARKDSLAVNEQHYTIQLIADAHEKNVTRFIQQNHLSDKAHYTHTHKNGEDWYEVLYGDYSTQQEAQVAVDQLPHSLRKLKPWIRQFSAIQADVKGTQQSVS